MFGKIWLWCRCNLSILVAGFIFALGCFTGGLLSSWMSTSALSSLIKSEYTVTELAAVMQAIAVFVGLGSVLMMWRQARENSKWNRLAIYHQQFDNLPDGSLARQAHDVLRLAAAGIKPTSQILNEGLGSGEQLSDLTEAQKLALSKSFFVGKGEPLDETLVKFINDCPVSSRVVRQYLDAFEILCGAINCGVLHEGYVRELEYNRVSRSFTLFQPLIVTIRGTGNSQAYVEVESVALRWQAFKQKQYDATERKARSLADRQEEVRRSVGVNRQYDS